MASTYPRDARRNKRYRSPSYTIACGVLSAQRDFDSLISEILDDAHTADKVCTSREAFAADGLFRLSPSLIGFRNEIIPRSAACLMALSAWRTSIALCVDVAGANFYRRAM